jgi:hypothetical protein
MAETRGKHAYVDGDDNPLEDGSDKGIVPAPQYKHTAELEKYYVSRFLGSKPAKGPNGGK